MSSKLLSYARAHRFLAAGAVIVAIGAGMLARGALTGGNGDPRYVLAAVTRGALISSISGTGQVLSVRQIELKPKVSGDVISVAVRDGANVPAGALIAQIDARDAQKGVRDAETNLASARLALQKLEKPADELALLQAEHALAQARESAQSAEDDLARAYEDGMNAVSNTFLDFPGIVSGLEDIFFDETIDRIQENIAWYVNQTEETNDRDRAIRYRNDYTAAHASARGAYETNFDRYKAASRSSPRPLVESLIFETYETAKRIADAVKAADNLIAFAVDVMERSNDSAPAITGTHQSSIRAYTGTTNSHLSSLLAVTRTIDDAKDAVTNAERSIAERDASLRKLTAGAEELDLASQMLAVEQRENALLDAREKLADYAIRAPIAGIIAAVHVKPGDTASPGEAAATIITATQLAKISLNEVDVASIAPGQTAKLTFDAIPDISITGAVAEIDAVGTASQGVVTYNVQIAFDTKNSQVRPGMTVNASIVTSEKPDVLMLPTGAVKSRGESAYVEVLPGADGAALTASAAGNIGVASRESPRVRRVATGLANDLLIEIVSGLAEGDRVILRTIAPQSGGTRPQAPSLFGAPGGGRGGGFRVPR